jgi:hypothetical protein
MSRFLTQLQAEALEDTSHDGRGTWQLLQALIYDSDVAGKVIVVPAGFVTDLASVPRIPVAFLLAGDTANHAAVVHDWLYTSHEVTKEVADNVLQEAAIVMGVPAWRAWLMWAGVHVGGNSSWVADGPKQPDAVTQQLPATAVNQVS